MALRSNKEDAAKKVNWWRNLKLTFSNIRVSNLALVNFSSRRATVLEANIHEKLFTCLLQRKALTFTQISQWLFIFIIYLPNEVYVMYLHNTTVLYRMISNAK